MKKMRKQTIILIIIFLIIIITSISITYNEIITKNNIPVETKTKSEYATVGLYVTNTTTQGQNEKPT